MNKIVIAISAVAIGVAGFGLGKWSSQSANTTSARSMRSADSTRYEYESVAPAISASEARNHRESNYAELDSIDGVLELPSDFAQTEALYTVAGRASQAELQELILQSIDIVNRYDRSAALNILFTRYAELDPDAAVEFLVELHLDIDDQVFRSLFGAWAKSDLNGAVAGANRLTNRRQRRHASHAVLTAASRYHQGLLEQVNADLEDNHELAHIRSEAIAIRANSDPLRAMQEAMAVDGQGRWSAVYRVATVWARNDPAGALSYSGEISDQHMRQQIVAAVLGRWIEDDPLQAMQYISAHPNAAERNEMLQSSLGAYARIQPEDALVAAGQLSGHAKTQAMQQVFGQWAKDDLDAAMSAVNAIDDRTQRNALMATVGQTLAQQSAKKALAWLDAMDSETRSAQMATVLQQIAPQDPRRALEYVMNNTSESERAGTMGIVMKFAMMSDLTVAQDYLDQLPTGGERDGLYQQLGSHMARRGGDDTMQWIAGLSGSAKTSAIKGAARSFAGSDPQLSATLIAQMSPADASETIQSVSRAMSYSDPQSALSWLEQFNGRTGYETALSSVVQAVARTDPQQALSLASNLSAENRGSVTRMALANWASTNPGAAANWASRSDPMVRSVAVEGVVQTWMRSDPAAAERWVFSLPVGDSKDAALISLAGGARDVRQMAGYIGSISSDAFRRQTIIRVYQGMLAKQDDMRAANEFLDNVGADSELRDQLSEMSGQ